MVELSASDLNEIEICSINNVSDSQISTKKFKTYGLLKSSGEASLLSDSYIN